MNDPIINGNRVCRLLPTSGTAVWTATKWLPFYTPLGPYNNWRSPSTAKSITPRAAPNPPTIKTKLLPSSHPSLLVNEVYNI